ncbi:hypothetical protein AB3480_11960 [Rhizobium mongolense]
MRKREFLTGVAVLALSVAAGGVGMAASNEPVDAAALAALRPGMPMSAVEKAMGSAWRTLAPHKGGIIDIVENTHGVIVRIDRKGLVGQISFNSRFEHTIAGVPMGISLDDLRTTLPDMQIGEESKVRRATRFGKKQLPEGELSVRITYDRVYEIEISNPDAEYAEPTAPPYPAASGAPGAPFSDPNLKLAVMSSLLYAKALDLGTPQQLASHVLGRTVDLEKDGDELIPEALDYLTRYPLSDEQLAAVERIEFDGSGAIYPFAWYFWGGEEGVFDVRDISGIRFCPNLKSISVNSMIDKVDIRALVPLKTLQRVSINVPSENIEALLDLPSLRTAGRFPPNPVTREIFEELERRGVQFN